MQIPWASTYLLRPGVPQDISLTINGVPAVLNCSASSIGLPDSAAASPVLPYEPNTFSLAAEGNCQYVYSSYLEARATAVAVRRTATNEPLLSINGTGEWRVASGV